MLLQQIPLKPAREITVSLRGNRGLEQVLDSRVLRDFVGVRDMGAEGKTQADNLSARAKLNLCLKAVMPRD